MKIFLLAHLSQRLIGELILYLSSSVRLSSVHPSVVVLIVKHRSETAWPIKATFCVEPPWVGGTKLCLRHLGHMIKMAATPYMVKTLQTSGTSRPISTKPTL